MRSTKKIFSKKFYWRAFLFTALLLLVAGAIYLNCAYAHIYATIDRAGLRSPYQEHRLLVGALISPRPPIRYVALGDSLTAGVGTTDPADSFPYQFAQRLGSERAVLLLNLAVPGARTIDVLDHQLSAVEQFQPDVISLLIGINDLHGGLSGVKIEKTTAQIIDQLTESTSAKILLLTVPYLGDRTLLYPPYRAFFDWRTRSLNQRLADMCQPPRCTLVDIYADTAPEFMTNPGLYSADHFHPNTAGYQLWANQLYAAAVSSTQPN